MEEQYLFIVFFGISITCLAIWGILLIAKDLNKKRIAKEKFQKEQQAFFNVCIDEILKGNIKEAKELYNILIDYDSKKPFINGVLIGMNLTENKQRLIDNKYKL